MDTKGFAAVIPVGLGTTLIYSPDINFGVEFGGRYSFSDYLDGYTSQYSSSNDVYYFFNFTFTYKLKTGPKGLPFLQMIMSWISFNEKISLVFIIFISICSMLSGQRSADYGVFGGVSSYIGDINPDKLLYAPLPAGGIFYRYNLHPRQALQD